MRPPHNIRFGYGFWALMAVRASYSLRDFLVPQHVPSNGSELTSDEQARELAQVTISTPSSCPASRLAT